MIATSQFTISVIKDGKDGAPGATGPQGISVEKVVKEYRLSDSSTELTGDDTLPAYQWSETKPKIPSGKYLWERERTDLSNNTSEHGTAHCDIVTSGLVLDVDRNTDAITSKVWESDITTKINEYDGSTGKSIRDRVTKTETNISGINTTISEIQTDVAGKADGSTVTTLTTKVNTISETVDGHTQTIESNTSRIDDAEDEIESTKTIASQTADKFTWLVKDGTSASNFTLTSRVAELISPEVVIKDPAGSATIISGGKIHANAITTAMLATDAIKSTNYTASSNASSPYSATGTYLNLANGNFYTPNFGIDNVHGEAYLNGEIIATSGSIGSNTTNYWEIGNVQDYNMTDSAVIRGHGTAYIQSGYWQLSNDKLNTQYYDSSQSSGVLTYYNDSGTYYDVGQKIPTNFAAYNVNDTPVVKWNKAWFYGRKYTGDSVPSFDSDWTYFFEVDSNGNVTTAGDIYEGGVKLSEKYAAITDVGSAYLPKTGGTITGNLTVNGAFSTNVMLQTNLASTSAGQLTGNANATVTHGVTGTLGVGNGGTGKSSWTANRIIYASATNALSQLGAGTSGQLLKSNGSSAPGWVDQSSIAAGSAINDSDGNAIKTTYRKLTNNDFDTINVTDLNAGNLIVTGAGRFTNGLYGDLIGNVTGNVVGNITGTSTGVLDSGDGKTITFQYSGSGISTTNWFGAWSGYKMMAISSANARNAMQALYNPRITTAATADTFTDNGLYTIAFGHSDDTTFPVTNNGNLFVSNPGTMYQLYMGDISMSIYKRVRSNSTLEWGAWSNIWDIGAKYDGNGDTISSTYLKLSGGTMTGGIIFNGVQNAISYQGTKATYPLIKFIDNNSDTYGNSIAIGGGGLVVIGGGESSEVIVSDYGGYTAGGGGSEELALGSDGGIKFYLNAQNGTSSAFKAFWNGAGDLYPMTTNTGSLGTSSHKWSNVYATTLHGKLDSKKLTVGNTGKNVDWSGDVSWSKEEISDVASNTTDGWMSKDDKAKLDQITVSDIGTVGANSIKGATNGGIDVTITSGVATLKHTNQLSSGGTAQGTANNTTLTNGGSFTIPTVTYDINGHITTAGTNKLTLPNITSVSGNAGTATKFASAQSVTLTGDTTGTASSQAGWSITTKTDRLSTVGDNRGAATTPNDYVNKIIFQGLKTNSSFGSPSTDQYSYVVGLRGWADSSGGNAHELAFNNSGIYRRSGFTIYWGPWLKMLDSDNYTDYTVTKTGSGASGTWGISITGNAATATSATNATNAQYLTHKSLNSTTINNTAGTFAFSGSGDPWDGTDWVGFQVGDNVDKFQISANASHLVFRQNDSGGTNTSWMDWVTILDTSNYSSYALPLAGGTMTGTITTTHGKEALHFPSTAGAFGAGAVYGTSGNEALSVVTKNAITSFMVVHGSDPATWANGTWQSAAPTLQTKNKSVYVNELIAQNTTPTYNFKVNGTSYLGGEVRVSHNNADTESVSLKYNEATKSLDFIFN